MKQELAPVNLRPGSTVRIHGEPYIVGLINDGRWHFTSKDGKHQPSYSMYALRQMMIREQLTSDAIHRALTADVQEAITIDWGSFTVAEQQSALRKYPYVEAIHKKLEVRFRDKRKHVTAIVDQVFAETKTPFGEEKPGFRQVRDWYRRWVAGGRDVRALIDTHRKRGNRRERLPEWVKEEIEAAIDEVYNCEIRGSEAATWRAAQDRILVRAARDNLPLPVGAKKVLGRNAIGRALAHRSNYTLIANRFTKQVADQLVRNMGVGPQGDWPLSDVEIDHTPLDLMVVHEDGHTVLNRPWVTALIDRYSRMIIGFALTFAPPSWVSVMEALSVAISPKEEFLASLGCGPFEFLWVCWGPPDRLYVDNGPEFRCQSMKASEAMLRMQIIDVPPARGDLKGKIESWWKKSGAELIHLLPGTTFSNPQKRLKYKSVEEARFTLAEAKWIVAKWVVDIYNQTEHPATDERPADRWKRGMEEHGGEKPPPPKGIIAPLVGLVITRKLRVSGIRYHRLRWNSNDLQALRDRIGLNADVLARIDPLKLRKVSVLDEETGRWVEGDLLAETAAEKLTLSQYEHVRKTLDDTYVFDDQHATKMARAARQIRDFIESKKKKSSVTSKRDARFVTEGRKPAEHIHQDRWDADASEQPLGSHDHLQEAPKSPPPDARGPWRERVFKSTAQAPATDESVAGSNSEDTADMQSSPRSSPPAAKPSRPSGRSETDVLESRRRK